MSIQALSNKKSSSCKLCLRNDYIKLCKKNGIDILQCKNCSFVFANFHIEKENIDNFSKNLYSEKYYVGNLESNSYKKIGYKKNYFENKKDEKLNFALHQIKQIEKIKPKKGKILDIGCAAGFFLKVAKDKGWDTTGLEISEFAAKYGREKFGLEIKTGNLDTIDFEQNYFDVITAWDVIEHVSDPRSFIQKIHLLLKDEGLLVLGTPNYDSLARKIKKSGWNHLRPPEHLSYFTPRTIQFLISSFFKNFSIMSVRSPLSKIDFSLINVIKRSLYLIFDNIVTILEKSEYLKVYAWK